jgi:hypothetical protein
VLGVMPTSIDLGEVPVGSTAMGTFAVVHNGATPVVLTAVTGPSSRWTVCTTLRVGSTIPANGRQTGVLQGIPRVAGPVTGSFVVEGNDGADPHTVTVTVTGI